MNYSLTELVAYARKHSLFYRNFYRHLPETVQSVEELPILDQNAFWAANQQHDNHVLTAPLSSGIVFRSGGTTGSPKFSVFSRDEWETFCKTFGRGMSCRVLEQGDRVANIFHAGELYASFLFINKSMEYASVPVVNFPMVGTTSFEVLYDLVVDFGIDTLAGVPTTIMAFAENLVKSGRPVPKLRKALFGGEAMYPDQIERLVTIFPGIRPLSIGYASVDAGLLGYNDIDCGAGQHKAFSPETIVEIIDDESGLPIREVGVAGRVVVTNLTRRLMPILRYPAGDRAQWCDGEDKGAARRFELMGRSEEAARVGPVSLYYEDMRLALKDAFESEGFIFQMILRHYDMKDELEFKLFGGDAAKRKALETKVMDTLIKIRPLLADFLKASKIHPVKITFVESEKELTNPRTGKLKRVIDERFKK